jgi:nitrite reductase (NADH) small subunit
MTVSDPERRRAVEEYPVGSVDDFPEGSHHVVRAGRREVGVFNIRGRFFGLPNLCPHQTGPLCESRRTHGTTVATAETGWQTAWGMEGEVVACPWHGLEYHVPTGQCLAFPEIRLRTYPVSVRDGQVIVTV